MKKQLFAVACLMFTLACSKDSTGTTSGADANINVQDDQFSPSSTTIKIGQKVEWDWKGSHQHNVNIVSGPNSPTQSKGTFDQTFAVAGTYTYYCNIHGSPTGGMRGTITVQP